MKKEIFIQRSYMPAGVETVFDWHARPGALERLSPPWDPVRVVCRRGGIQKHGRAVLKLKAGPFPCRWEAEHFDYEKNRLFRDRQVKGPFAEWVHAHRFEAAGENQCLLEDEITYALPFHPLGYFLANAMVRQKLAAIFAYRHATLHEDLSLHAPVQHQKAQNILISGAGGLIGSALIPFLTTGGHSVRRLIRQKIESAGPQHSYWNPLAGEIDTANLNGTDVIIHLAGENIGEGRWTAAKKRQIVASRTKGTFLIAKTATNLKPLPKVLVCASAIGYYGHRGSQILTEDDSGGDDFISGVCRAWESAAEPALQKGIRVVFLRIGVALSPLGGALQKFYRPFQLGLGATLGSGDQYLSWIGIDDVLGAIHHAIFNPAVEGPVNVVAPHPVTHAHFTRTLAEVLARPAFFRIPERLIQQFFGEMGQEVLLSSTRVLPQKLIQTGYRFRHPHLREALAHLFGKTL